MAKQRTDSEASKGLILGAALELLRESGSSSVTVAAVAERAGCAKGLVHCHFKTKQKLWEAAAEHLTERRVEAWREAFLAPSPSEAIQSTWHLLARESSDGTIVAWTSILDPGSAIPDRDVSRAVQAFGSGIAEAAGQMFTRLGVEARIPHTEIGWMLASMISGMGFLLTRGADEHQLENAYAAAWLGILSLAE
jgi:AcrR family transcriptional regulator